MAATPSSRRTILPVGGLVFFVLFLLRMAWPVFFVARNSAYVAYIMAAVCMLGISSVIMRYVNILKFRRIRTAFHVTENTALLTQFLKFQLLAYTQHPEAPEVFMIMSRALGGDDNYREVMIFIADDRQILINSHFVNQKFTITPPSRQYRQMAQMLQHWLNKHINNSDRTDISVHKF